MNTIPSTAFLPDELKLVQLACVKLGALVQGTFSIGLPALISGVPNPGPFFETRMRVLNGFAQVLHTISGTAQGQREILNMREKSRAILGTLDDLARALLMRTGRSVDIAPIVAQLRDGVSALCDEIGEFADLINVDGTQFVKVKEVIFSVIDGVEAASIGASAPLAS